MKISQIRIENAWMVANGTLARFRYPGTEGLRLFRFRRAGEATVQFLREEREKLIAEYHGEKMESGLAKFPDPESCAAFSRERDELERTEIEMEELPIRLRMPAGIELSPAEWEALDGMIELYEPEETAAPVLRIVEAPAADDAPAGDH